MPKNQLPNPRHSIRLPGYDYSQPGAYFVTLVTHHRECSLGEISAWKMRLSLAGAAAAAILQVLPAHFMVELDAWVVMPNHLHAILVLLNPEGEASRQGWGHQQNLNDWDALHLCTQVSPLPPRGTIRGSLGAIVQNYKSIAARRINAARGSPGSVVWQRNYYEHIIRSKVDYEHIWEYIQNNPRCWAEDTLRPGGPAGED
jgi:putative transposase